MEQQSNRTANGERLVLHAPPQARVVLFETQQRLMPDAPVIERYSTAHKVVFERHVYLDGRVNWYKVQK